MGKRGPKPKLPLPGETLSWRRKQALIKEYGEQVFKDCEQDKAESKPETSARLAMPDFLSLEGKEVWDLLAPHLDLDIVASFAFASYCQWQGRAIKYERIIAKKGEIYRQSNGWTVSKELKLAKDATNEALKLYDKLGLGKRRLLEQRQEENKELSELEKRRQRVLGGRQPLTDEEKHHQWILQGGPKPTSD